MGKRENLLKGIVETGKGIERGEKNEKSSTKTFFKERLF